MKPSTIKFMLSSLLHLLVFVVLILFVTFIDEGMAGNTSINFLIRSSFYIVFAYGYTVILLYCLFIVLMELVFIFVFKESFPIILLFELAIVLLITLLLFSFFKSLIIFLLFISHLISQVVRFVLIQKYQWN